MKRRNGLAAVVLSLPVFALAIVGATAAQERQLTHTYSDGSRYEGGIRNGRRHGRGTMTWPNGHKYVGHWRDGRIHGIGTYRWPDGQRYVGNFRNGRRTGHGTHTWPNGDKYVGEFVDGKLHGRGTMIYADDSRHEGEWRNGRRLQDEVRGRAGTRPTDNAQLTDARDAELRKYVGEDCSIYKAHCRKRYCSRGAECTSDVAIIYESCVKARKIRYESCVKARDVIYDTCMSQYRQYELCKEANRKYISVDR